MTHKFFGDAPFAESPVDNSSSHEYGYVRPEPDITHTTGRSGVRVPTYPRGNSALAGRLIHNLGHNNVERLVEPPSWRPQPLDADMVLAPASLEILSVPVADRPVEVEGSAIPEVKPRPSVAHSPTGYTHPKAHGAYARNAKRRGEELVLCGGCGKRWAS